MFATEKEALAALDEFLKGRTYRTLDRWIHRLTPATTTPETPE